MASVRSVAAAMPAHYYDQEALVEAAKRHWIADAPRRRRLESLFRNTQVEGRHLALPIDELAALSSFEEANAAYIRCGVELGARAASDALKRAGLSPSDVDHVFCATTTGVATPSIDARIANRIGLRRDVKRTPLFGLGCVAGAAGLARASDYLLAYPDEVALLLAVELCSLTLQRDDASLRNLIASGLFGDGAAAAVLCGSGREDAGPRVVASRSVLFPDTEEMMGWDVTGSGFRVVLSAEVPNLVRDHVRGEVDGFLAEHGLDLRAIESYVCHPGGPKILRALAHALDLPDAALQTTWDSLARIGNISSASVLLVLEETMRRPPRAGSLGLLIGMGPGFCGELVLLEW